MEGFPQERKVKTPFGKLRKRKDQLWCHTLRHNMTYITNPSLRAFPLSQTPMFSVVQRTAKTVFPHLSCSLTYVMILLKPNGCLQKLKQTQEYAAVLWQCSSSWWYSGRALHKLSKLKKTENCWGSRSAGSLKIHRLAKSAKLPVDDVRIYGPCWLKQLKAFSFQSRKRKKEPAAFWHYPVSTGGTFGFRQDSHKRFSDWREKRRWTQSTWAVLLFNKESAAFTLHNRCSTVESADVTTRRAKRMNAVPISTAILKDGSSLQGAKIGIW